MEFNAELLTAADESPHISKSAIVELFFVFVFQPKLRCRLIRPPQGYAYFLNSLGCEMERAEEHTNWQL